MQPFDAVIEQLLTISNFQDDKQIFIKEFESQNYLEVMLNLIDHLPEEKQDTMREIIRLEDSERVKDYLATFVSQEEFQRELNRVRTLALKDLMKALLPTLSSEQIRKVDNLLGSQIMY